MTNAVKDVQADRTSTDSEEKSTLIETLKATSRLLPRQLNDEIELAKIELNDKKKGLGLTAAYGGVALVFLALLVIALVVAAIAGLAVVVPLWLSALIVSGALLLIAGIAGLLTAKKAKSLMPLVPEKALRGLRYDLGVARQGSDFDPSTLDKPELTAEEKSAKKAQDKADADAAEAEKKAKEAEHGPKASEEELLKRTETRREHLTALRAELIDQASVTKQSGYALNAVKDKFAASPLAKFADFAGQGAETAKERWKPLTVFAISITACAVLLRKLFKK